uniref:Protein kinase domain-containing protein n=1 Tax=Rhabditophanes sp. KR3021 TaxID=114890 RepID=A0AC35TQ67_9BILA
MADYYDSYGEDNLYNRSPSAGAPQDISDPVISNEKNQQLGSDDEEQEDANDYKVGGYYFVKIGDVFNLRYHVIRKLGWGHFSTVWLCWDVTEKRFVALKILKSAAHYTEAAYDEIKLLARCKILSDVDTNGQRIVQMLDQFTIPGTENQNHVVMVFEVLGSSLLKLIIKSNYQGLPLDVVRNITKQILESLWFLHESAGIIHTDIKPENVLITMDHAEIKKMATEAIICRKKGLEMGGSAVAAVKPEQVFAHKSYTKNQKKRMRKKKKKNMKKLTEQLQDVAGIVVDTDNIPDDIMTSSRIVDNGDSPVRMENGDVSTGALSPSDFASPANEHPPYDGFDDAKSGCSEGESSTFGVKLADLGNACWVDHHFTEDIQTRQYRSLEVLIGAGYGPPADIWSLACMVFELATGDYLFEPHSSGTYSRDEDHLAHIIELLGNIPQNVFKKGKYWQEYFHKDGRLIRIQSLKPWPLIEVLKQKYNWEFEQARDFTSFLLPMLEYDQDARATAKKCLQHKWITGGGNKNC